MAYGDGSPAPQNSIGCHSKRMASAVWQRTRDGVLLVSLSGGVARFVDGELEIAYPPSSFDAAIRVSTAAPGPRRGSLAGRYGRRRSRAFPSGNDRYLRVIRRSLRRRRLEVVSRIVKATSGSRRLRASIGFARLPVATYSVKQGLTERAVDSVLAAQDGSIWMGTSVGLNRWDRGHVTSPWRPADVNGVGSIFQDSLGRVWVSTANEVGYLEGEQVCRAAWTSQGARQVDRRRRRRQCLDCELARRGLVRFSCAPERSSRSRGIKLKQTSMPVAVAADRSLKGVWLGFRQGRLLYFADGQVRASYGSAEGIADGLRGLHLDRDGTLWAATDGGLSRVKNGRVATLTVRNGLPCDGVEWLVEDDDRAFWLGTRCGLVRIARTDLTDWTVSVDAGHECHACHQDDRLRQHGWRENVCRRNLFQVGQP